MARFKKYLKRGAIGLGAVMGILLIVNAVFIWIYGGRLEDRLEKIKADGHPVSLADLASEPPPSEQNAATFLRRARDDVDAVDRELSDVYDREGFGEGRVSQEDVETLRSAFEAYPRVIPLLQQAADAPHFHPDLDYTLPPSRFLGEYLEQLQRVRSCARVLQARAVLLHSRGKHDQSIQTCVLLLRLCRHADRCPMLIGHLVSLACRAVAVETANATVQKGSVSSSAREALQTELRRHDLTEPFRHALRTERAYGLARYHRILNQIGTWPVRPMFLDDTCDFVDLMGRNIELAPEPYAVVAQEKSLPEASSLRKLAGLMMPALTRAHEATARTQARLRCLRILIALQGIQADVKDAPDLTDLDLPAKATTDPFTGEPLHVKQTDGGWLVYSVGKNLKDDGGALDEQKDVGLAPPDPGE